MGKSEINFDEIRRQWERNNRLASVVTATTKEKMNVKLNFRIRSIAMAALPPFDAKMWITHARYHGTGTYTPAIAMPYFANSRVTRNHLYIHVYPQFRIRISRPCTRTRTAPHKVYVAMPTRLQYSHQNTLLETICKLWMVVNVNNSRPLLSIFFIKHNNLYTWMGEWVGGFDAVSRHSLWLFCCESIAIPYILFICPPHSTPCTLWL